MVPPYTAQAEQRDPVAEFREVVSDTGFVDRIQRSPDLGDAVTVVRQLLTQAVTLGIVRVLHVSAYGTVIELPDGEVCDYVVLGDCGHVSPLYTGFERAIGWTCSVCAEERWHVTTTRLIVTRLDHACSVAMRDAAVSSKELR